MDKEYAQRTFLHHLLDRQRMSQKYLAELMGVDRPNVSLWLSGKRLPMVETIHKMADILQVDRDWLHGHMVGMNIQRVYGIENMDVLNHVKDNLESQIVGNWYARWGVQ